MVAFRSALLEYLGAPVISYDEIAAAVTDDSGRFRGSAFLISPRLALTASFVAEISVEVPSSAIQVWPIGADSGLKATTIWSNSDTSIALLQIDGGSENEAAGGAWSASFGRIVGPGRRDCELTGFRGPWRDDDSNFVARRITGTVDPEAFPGSNFMIFDPSRPITERGFSGAGLCSDGHLIGVI